MDRKKIFITGASGCVGHYVLDQYKDRNDVELHLLLRDPRKLDDYLAGFNHVVIHQGSMDEIEKLKEVIADMNAIIHIATVWGGGEAATVINREKTHELFHYTTDKCDRIVYFSTASILGAGNKVIKEAEDLGTGYVISKYRGYQMIQKAPFKDKITVLFPTLVFGGDATHPYSHLSSGLKLGLKHMRYLRFLSIKAGAHFLHAADIAAVTTYVLDHDKGYAEYALGVPKLDGDDFFDQFCNYFKIKRWFKIPLTSKFILRVCRWLNVEMTDWDRHCIKNSYMVFDVVDPSTFGLSVRFPTLHSVIDDVEKAKKKETK